MSERTVLHELVEEVAVRAPVALAAGDVDRRVHGLQLDDRRIDQPYDRAGIMQRAAGEAEDLLLRAAEMSHRLTQNCTDNQKQ